MERHDQIAEDRPSEGRRQQEKVTPYGVVKTSRHGKHGMISGTVDWWRLCSKTLRHLENMLFLARFKGFDRLDPPTLKYYFEKISERAAEAVEAINAGYAIDKSIFTGRDVPPKEKPEKPAEPQGIDPAVRGFVTGTDMADELTGEVCDMALVDDDSRVEFWKSYDGTLTRVILGRANRNLAKMLETFFGHPDFINDASGKDVKYIDMNTPWARKLAAFLMNNGYSLVKKPAAVTKVTLADVKRDAPPELPDQFKDFIR